ncbi:hypothetical protein KC19_11G111000 [Ceratodon purpureus]|uniref:C2H2-type domain-containing protein n=1 Tax=Ceratodon purpureus TaxID=3225 RepID=A0A8T0GCT1_CERPU|nr:hypothetical protein KC19_11G111000 [Ceratodon purpureus]
MAVTAPPSLQNFYNDAGFQLPMGGLSSIGPGHMLNDGGPLSLGSALGMTGTGATSFYNYGDTSNFGAPWEYLYNATPTSIFNLPNNLSPTLSFGSDSSVYSTDETDLLLTGNETDEFLQHINGCSPVTMHPNLVSTLKNMVTPGVLTYNAQPSVLDRLEQLNRLEAQQQEPGQIHDSLRSAFLRQYCQQSVVPKVELPDLSPASIGAVVPCTVTDTEEPSKAAEKSETEESIEAAVVSVDLIKNRRPFRCQHEGCNKTFKNPQTMKMHHKTHYSDGSAGGKACTLPTLTSSLKAGHNKKTPSRCPKCKKTFVGLYELRRHYGRKHSEGEKPFGCRKCGKKFYIEVDVRDHEKLCGEPIECKCGLKFAFKCNLVAHKKAHPACQDNPQPNSSNSNSTSTTSNNQTSSSDDSEQSLGSSRQLMRVGSKRIREESTSPGIQSSLHIPIPDFKGIPEAPEFKLTRREFPPLSFPPETNPLWASNMVYPTISFTNLPVSSALYSNLGSSFHGQQQYSTKVSLPPASISPSSYEAVNCEMGNAFNQLPFKAWSG